LCEIYRREHLPDHHDAVTASESFEKLATRPRSLSRSLFSSCCLSFFLFLLSSVRGSETTYCIVLITVPLPTLHTHARGCHSDAASFQLLFVNFIIIVVFKTEENCNVRRGGANKW